jgi:ubiquinone/menaquinone biosynthesis C-methylase UbiE
MGNDISSELYRDLPPEGSGRLEYTRKAFQMLPKMERPNILDIGCGKGEPTIELANLSNGLVTGLDIDQPSLDELKKKAEELNLSGRIKTLKCSMFDMDLPDERFDVTWAEGSIWFLGFEKGLREWRRFIKPNGFLVVHEMCWLRPDPPLEMRDHWEKSYPGIRTIKENLDMIPGCGYIVIGHFPLPEDAWWDLYYGPLAERIQPLRKKYGDDPESLAVLDKEQKEIDLYRKYSKWYGSAFYIMEKR